ncbi:SRPBCC family protein [Streptomyces carminius]|nr:SRPBCC family protein [Streptomyces carminius]
MPQVRVYVSIPLPVEEVFGYLADGCNLADWHSGVMEVRPDGTRDGARDGTAGTDGTAGADGTDGTVEAYRYRFPGRRHECLLTRAVCEPPVRVGFVGQRMWTPLGTQVPRYDFRLWPREGGCRVEVGVTSSLSGAMVLLWPVVACGWRRDLPFDAQRLYERLTGGGGEPVAEEERAVLTAYGAAGGGPAGSLPGDVPAPDFRAPDLRSPAASLGAAGGLGAGPDISTDPGFGPVEPCWRASAEPRWRRSVRRFRPVPHG